MNRPAGLTVRSISQPLVRDLGRRPFGGRVETRSAHAWNVIDDGGRLITLVDASLGDGPFSVVLGALPEGTSFLRVDISSTELLMGSQRWSLASATRWSPFLPPRTRACRISARVRERLSRHSRWDSLPVGRECDGWWVSCLRGAGVRLSEALVGNRRVEHAVSNLAGLGPGLTPAGDDYLVGAMAALYLVGGEDILASEVVRAAAHTTIVSRGYLDAAAAGGFTEPWHRLAVAIADGCEPGVERALRTIGDAGATSGYYAVRGFTKTLLDCLTSPSGRGRGEG